MRVLNNFTRTLVVLSVVIGIAVLSIVVAPSTIKAQDKNANVFKVPDGYMKAPLPNFRGMLVLDPKKPAGMFVTYPNENESLADLKKRVVDFVGPMFQTPGKPKPVTWTVKPLPAHPGDGDGKATLHVSSEPTREVQIAIYERTTGVPFVYAYFGMRHLPGKGDDAKFVDEQGNGVKAFDKLWKSFPK